MRFNKRLDETDFLQIFPRKKRSSCYYFWIFAQKFAIIISTEAFGNIG